MIRYWSTDADQASATIVAEHKFMGTSLKNLILSIPTVDECSFNGHADVPFLTDEAFVKVPTKYGGTNSVNFAFLLLGQKVYPASPRTKYLVEQLEACETMDTIPKMAILMQDAPDNDTLFWPEPLGAKPMKE